MIRCTRSSLALNGSFFTFVGLGFRKLNIWRKFRSIKFKTLWGLPKYLRRSVREEESMVAQKIATCSYCGTKAALVLRGKDSHELSCGSRGAPLHDLKRLPVEQRAKTSKKRPADPWHPGPKSPQRRWNTKRNPRKRKGSVSWKQPLMWSKMCSMKS